MGRATKWFRGLFGLKKPDSGLSASKPSKEKRRWSFVKSYREKDNHVSGPISNSATVPDEYDEGEESQQTTFSDGVVDPNKRAIAVAAATAAVAEAAVVAAQAAAAVVRLTSSGRCASNPVEYVNGNCIGVREERAAIRIQAAFRGCLARRALRALKGLVRLQALVRGHIERKRTVEWLRRMQALLQAQKIARSMRAYVSDSSNSNGKSSQFHQPGPATPEKFERGIRSKSMKLDQSSVLRKSGSKAFCRNISYQDNAHSSGLSQSDVWLDERSVDQLCSSSKHTTPVDEKSDRIVEIDTGKPRRRRNLFRNSNHGPSTSDQSFTTSKDSTNNHQTDPSPPSCEVQSPSPLKLVGHEVEESSFWTTHNSPQFYSASLRCCDGPKRSPFTPTKSDGSRSFLNGYSDYPNYMAYTESSKAKVRSLSAPKQRPQYERSSSAKRCYVGSSAQKMHTLHANFTNKAYPGSGRLDNMGMPIGYTY